MKRTDDQRYEDIEMGLKVREASKGEDDIDRESMQKLAELIEKGYCHKSYKHYRSMDTFVREGIPEEVVTYIYLRNETKHRVVQIKVRLKGCKRTFKKELGEGVIYIAECVFPASMSREHVASCMVNKEREILEDLIEFRYSDSRKA